MIKGIGHLAFTVKDMEKSLYFYCDILGLKKAFSIQDDMGNPWIEYIKVAPGQFIELFYGGSEGDAEKPKEAGYSHLCLEVEDIHGIAHRIKKMGLSLDSEPRQGKDGNYQCWIRDPDGNRIEFMQLHPDSPQRRS
ncbi:MAG: VOC family protein [Clostridia bacterium]|jgi:catechol 2,3-dioxygenase-like lactoylglutathione lyase family enzyme